MLMWVPLYSIAQFLEDGDPALFLKIVGVHHPLGHLLVFAEGAGLAQKLVDKRGLPWST